MIGYVFNISHVISLDRIREYTPHTFAAIIIIALMICVSKGLLKLGFRVLISILMIVGGLLLAPRISDFIVARAGLTDVAEKIIYYIVDEDIEEKVKRDYRMMASSTDAEIEDPALLDRLKAEAYTVDPNLSDEENIFRNLGLPDIVYENVPNSWGSLGYNHLAQNSTSFPDFVAKFFVSRMITFISYVIAFMIMAKAFKPYQW